jgi:hypothetical protein
MGTAGVRGVAERMDVRRVTWCCLSVCWVTWCLLAAHCLLVLEVVAGDCALRELWEAFAVGVRALDACMESSCRICSVMSERVPGMAEE